VRGSAGVLLEYEALTRFLEPVKELNGVGCSRSAKRLFKGRRAEGPVGFVACKLLSALTDLEGGN